MEFEKDCFKIGERYGRVLFLRDYASYIKDAMVTELTDLDRNLMLSIDVIPVPTDEAVKDAESRLLGSAGRTRTTIFPLLFHTIWSSRKKR